MKRPQQLGVLWCVLLWLPSITISRVNGACWLLRSGPDRALPPTTAKLTLCEETEKNGYRHEPKNIWLIFAPFDAGSSRGCYHVKQAAFCLALSATQIHRNTRAGLSALRGLFSIIWGLVLPTLCHFHFFAHTSSAIMSLLNFNGDTAIYPFWGIENL